MSSLDRELALGSKQQLTKRLAAILQIVKSLQSLTSLDVNALCTLAAETPSLIVTTPPATPGEAPTVETATPDDIIAALNRRREAYAAQQLAAEKQRDVDLAEKSAANDF